MVKFFPSFFLSSRFAMTYAVHPKSELLTVMLPIGLAGVSGRDRLLSVRMLFLFLFIMSHRLLAPYATRDLLPTVCRTAYNLSI